MQNLFFRKKKQMMNIREVQQTVTIMAGYEIEKLTENFETKCQMRLLQFLLVIITCVSDKKIF